MNIGATICGFLAGVIFALVLMAIPPAIERFQAEARVALQDSCHVLELPNGLDCPTVYATAHRPAARPGTCET